MMQNLPDIRREPGMRCLYKRATRFHNLHGQLHLFSLLSCSSYPPWFLPPLRRAERMMVKAFPIRFLGN